MLEDFIKNESQKSFAWGLTDCGTTSDNWIKLNRGYSMLEQANRKYSNEIEAREIIKKHGNFFFALLYVAEIDKAIETATPEKGDVAAIVFGENLICSAIHCGEFWFSRNETGIIGAPIGTRFMKAWKLNKNG